MKYKTVQSSLKSLISLIYEYFFTIIRYKRKNDAENSGKNIFQNDSQVSSKIFELFREN